MAEVINLDLTEESVGGGGGGAVSSVNGQTGAVVLSIPPDNSAQVATNTADISTNAADIANLEAVGAEQNVQSDWNEADNTSDSFVLNKPTIPADNSAAVASNTTAHMNNATSIATNSADISALQAVGAEQNVKSDWNETDSTSDSFIENKPTIPADNSAAVATNATNIANNTTNISSNDTDIANNLTAITALQAVGAEQNVQPDWNETDNTSDAFILNKPTIGVGGETNVQSDWNETDNTSDAFVLNKPTIPADNSAAVAANTAAHTTNATNISSNDTDIATNTTNIGNNSTAIGSNTTNITANATAIANLDTDDVTEAGNLYYTEARVNANVTVAANKTAVDQYKLMLSQTTDNLTITAGAITLDHSLGSIKYLSLTENVTSVAESNIIPGTEGVSIILRVDNTGSFGINWTGSGLFPLDGEDNASLAPAQGAGATSEYYITRVNGKPVISLDKIATAAL